MIYVIVSAAFSKEDSYTEYENIIKIGYSKDEKRVHEGRFASYVTQNPTCKILYKILGGTEKDERDLHRLFKRFRKTCNKSREWFEYRKEILEFFRTHTTIESIRKEIKKLGGREKLTGKRYKENLSKSLPVVWPYIVSIREVVGELDYSILEDYSEGTNCEEWIKVYYPDESKEIIKYYKETQSRLTSKMKECIEYLRNPANGYVCDRLRYLCENEDFTEEEKKVIAQQTSEKFDQYYNMVGPKRCAELGYNTTGVRNEIKNLLADEEKLCNLIYESFLKGGRYSKADIKKRLGEIYEECGITSTPKATDLNKYFKIKDILFTSPDDKTKKINGFEILGVKD